MAATQPTRRCLDRCYRTRYFQMVAFLVKSRPEDTQGSAQWVILTSRSTRFATPATKKRADTAEVRALDEMLSESTGRSVATEHTKDNDGDGTASSNTTARPRQRSAHSGKLSNWRQCPYFLLTSGASLKTLLTPSYTQSQRKVILGVTRVPRSRG